MALPTGAPPVVGARAETRMMTTMEQSATIDLEGELAALERARQAVEDKLAKLAGISGGGADAMADEYIDAVVAGTIDKLQHELVVFGRIDDEHAWRVGLYGMGRYRSTGATHPPQLVFGFGNTGVRAIEAGIAAIGPLLRG